MTDKPATFKQLRELEAAAIEFCKQGKAGGHGYLWETAAYKAARERLRNAVNAVDPRTFYFKKKIGGYELSGEYELSAADNYIVRLKHNGYAYSRDDLAVADVGVFSPGIPWNAGVKPKPYMERRVNVGSILDDLDWVEERARKKYAREQKEAADIKSGKVPLTLEQLQAIETAAMHVSAFLVDFKAGKAKAADAQLFKMELLNAVKAAGGKTEWATEIYNTIYLEVKKGFDYERSMLNGAKRVKIDNGYADMLDRAETAMRDAGQASLVSIVGRGVPIDADGTNANHDGARKEAARILESWLDLKNPDTRNALGLKANEGFDIIDGNGKLNRRNLDKALRFYQKYNVQDADGRIGSVTANQLLYDKDTYQNAPVYSGSVVYKSMFGKGGAYLCGKARDCDELQKYEDGTAKGKDGKIDEAADAIKKDARDAIIQVRKLINHLKDKVISEDNLNGKNLTDKEKAALKTFAGAITADKNLTKDEIKAFQTAFGLKDDGIIGRQTTAAAGQVGMRLSAFEVIDPSEIKAAVQTQAGAGHRPRGKQHS